MALPKALKALRRFCMNCQGGYAPSVQQCADTECCLFAYRLCTLSEPEPDARPLRAMRLYCLSCAGSRDDVRRCDARETCGLWSYRFGVLPSTFKRVLARRKKKRTELWLPGFQEQKSL